MTIIAGRFTITTGLHRGAKHTYITHQETGRQWVSKSPDEGENLDRVAQLIKFGFIQFNPTQTLGSCDSRFWQALDSAPKPSSTFDALCFIGE